jgi:hypothetical protein
MRKLITLASAWLITHAAFAQTGSPGFFLNGWKAKNITIPTYVNAAAPTTAASTTVTINAANSISQVSPYVYGHNAAVWGTKLNQNPGVVQTLNNLGPNVLRWPGGNMSNDYFWDASSKTTCPRDLPPNFVYSDLFYGANNNAWTMSLDHYYDLLQKTNSQGIICVNYAYARYGTSANPVAQAAHYAADWVRYDRGRTKFWEIGNENFGDWETGYEIDLTYNKDGQPKRISGDLYGRHCKVFIDSMKKAAREIGVDIKIGVVTHDGPSNNEVWKNWNPGMMTHAGAKADFLAVHSYYTPFNQNSDPATILNTPTTVTKEIREHVLSNLQQYSGVSSLPIALTEWNIFAKGSQQSTSYINGIHAAMNLGEFVKNNYGLATRWDLMNGYDNGNSHGLLGDGETDLPKFSPRAPFFYMYYFQKFFGDRMVSSTVAGSTDIVSYASTFTSGQSGVVVVNKGGTTQTVDIKIDNFNHGTRYYYYILTGGSDATFSRKVFINGNGPGASAGGPTNYTALQPYGTNIVNKSVKITLPKYSVAYVMVEKSSAVAAPEMDLKQGTTSIASTSGTYTFPNPIAVGASSFAVPFTILNTGNSNLTLGAITKGGNNPLQFVVSAPSSSIVAPGASATFTITFSPTFVGTKSATISISNNDGNENPYIFTVNANTLITTCSANISSTSNSFCHGGNLLLVANSGTAYLWKNGTTAVGTSASYTATTAGSYTVEVTSASGCKATSAPKVITTITPSTWYQDVDGDGKGDATKTISSCTQPSGYVAVAGDACPTDALKTTPGNCGCNKSETSCLDCAGVPNGTAKLDACGKCAGGTTGIIPTTNVALCGGSDLSGINGPGCGKPLQTLSYTLDASKRTNVTNYSWWFTGSSDAVTKSADGVSASIKLSQYYTTGQVCVGVNLSVSPYYTQYCRSINTCAARIGQSDEESSEETNVLHMYPNPAANEVTIDMTMVPEKIELVNSLGKVVLVSTQTDLETKIYTSALEQGTYSVKVYSNGNVLVRKLVIVK